MATASRLRIALYDAFALFEGSGRAMLDLVGRLDRSRFDPVVVCPRTGGLIAAAIERGHAAEVIEPPGRLRRYGKALLAGGLLSASLTGAAVVAYAVRLAGWLRARRIGLLHCNQTRAVLQAGLAGRLARVPVVWTVRIQEPLPALATRFAGWCADVVAPVSASCLDGFAGREALARKVRPIPLGVDTGRFAPPVGEAPMPYGLQAPPGARLVVMVGGLHPRKRHDLLLEAAPSVLQGVPEAHVVIVGGGFEDTGDEYAERLRRRRAELGLQERVVLAGRREDVPAILARAEVFVLPSDQEGLPGAVIEAMATGKACVVTPAAAAPVEDGLTGLVVPPGDPGALAEAVIRLLQDAELASRMGRAGRAVAVERYSLEATVREYEGLYARLTA